jgi:hypothetical protein
LAASSNAWTCLVPMQDWTFDERDTTSEKSAVVRKI